MTEPPDVAAPSAAVAGMRPDWEQAEALLGGTRAMRAAGKKFLPQWPAEDDKAYLARLGVAVLFPAYGRTVETLVGKPFSKPVTLSDDMPPEVTAWMQNVDLEGRNLTNFAGGLMVDQLAPGMGFILVEYPVAATDGPRPRTQAEEQQMGLRPYWLHIRPKQFLGAIVQRKNGTFNLMQFRFMECVEVPNGPWAMQEVEQVRVLTPGAWSTHRKNDKGEWVPHEEGRTTLDFIPVVPVYGKRTGYMTSDAPLRDLAFLNIAHYQSASDQQNILHTARVPILVRKGATVISQDANGNPMASELKIGAGVAVDLPENGDLVFCEHTGAAIGAGQDDLDKLEERMRQAGAELLVIKPGEVTATQTATENAVGMCALQRMTLDLQDALNTALEYTAKWAKLPKGGAVALFHDFGALTLEAAQQDLILSMQQSGLISKETAIGELKRRGVLADNVDPKTEAERVAEEGPPLGTINMPPPEGGGGNEGA
jgi:hypothetical protein